MKSRVMFFILILTFVFLSNCQIFLDKSENEKLIFMKTKYAEFYTESLSDDCFVITWRNSLSNDIHLQVISSEGKVKHSNSIKSEKTVKQSDPKICTYSELFIIFFKTTENEMDESGDLWAQKFTNSGEKIDLIFKINSDIERRVKDFTVSCTADSYYLTFSSNSNVFNTIKNHDGVYLKKDFPLIQHVEDSKLIPQRLISTISSNEYLLAYTTQLPSFNLIQLDHEGNFLKMFKPSHISQAELPSITFLNNGNIVCVWQTNFNSDVSYIAGEIYNSSLSIIKPFFEIFRAETDSYSPHVMQLKSNKPDEGFLVSFSFTTKEGKSQIILRHFSSDGTPKDFTLNKNTEQGNLLFPTTVSNSENKILLVYSSDGEIRYDEIDNFIKINSLYPNHPYGKSFQPRLLYTYTTPFVTDVYTSGAAITDHDSITGDDKGGIAVTSSYFYILGDSAAARYPNGSFGGGTSLTVQNGIFVDLYGSGQLYTLWNCASNQFISSTITCIKPMDVNLNIGTSQTILTQSINMSGSGSMVFSGYKFVILWSGASASPSNTFWRIDIQTGKVTNMGATSISFSVSENWAAWGWACLKAPGTINNFYIYYVENSSTIKRKQINGSDNDTLLTGSFSDMANIVYSPWNSKWYFHYEGGSGTFGGSSETSGYASGSHLMDSIICHSSCSDCVIQGDANSTNCTVCASGLYGMATDPSNCGAIQDGYVLNPSTGYLVQCYDSCKKCIALGTPTNHGCSECKDNYYPQSNLNSNCLTGTVPNFRFDTPTLQYRPCYVSCMYCSADGDSTNHDCTNCAGGYYARSDLLTNCFNTAPPYYYLNTAINPYLYRPCYSSCQQCSADGNSATHNCLSMSCRADFYPSAYNNTFCYPSNEPGWYLASAYVYRCYTGCQTCSGGGNASNMLCTSCLTNYFPQSNINSNCLTGLVPNFRLDTPTLQYRPCYVSCMYCSADGDYNSHNCSTCATNYYARSDLLTNCYNLAPTFYYFNTAITPWRFVPCYSTCQTCYGEGTLANNNCNLCLPGYYKTVNNAYNCYNAPPTGFYFNTNLYYFCWTGCYTCTGSGNSTNYMCSSCLTGWYAKSDMVTNCYSSVPYAYRFDSPTSQYRPCYLSCGSCYADGDASAHNCITCISGYYKKSDAQSTCLNTAPTYYYFKATTQMFTPCYLSCLTCNSDYDGTEHYCTACKAGYYPRYDFLSRCFDVAPYSLYLNNIRNQWEQCYFSCAYCTGLGNIYNHLCTTCATGYFPLSDSLTMCYVSPPIFYYFNVATQQHRPCYYNCERCSADGIITTNNCTKCRSGYYPRSDDLTMCYNIAPPGYWFDVTSLLFRPCYWRCATCVEMGSDTDHKCLTCIDKYYKLIDRQSMCYTTTCIDGYYYDPTRNVCDNCDVSCFSCITSPKNCTKCNYAGIYYPLYDKLNSCYQTYPNLYWKDPVTITFQPCHSTCYECLDATMNCVKCAPMHLRIEGSLKCTLKCPSNLITNIPEMLCQPCIPPCNTCVLTRTNCMSCIAGFNLQVDNNTCKPVCLLGYYLEKGKCLNCVAPCATCSTAANCLTCLKGFSNEEDTANCVAKCRPNYFFDAKNNICMKCDSLCATCEKKKTCLTCTGTLLLMSDSLTCVPQCPNGYYQDPTNICKPCADTCLTCKDAPNICVTCPSGNYFLPNDPGKLYCMNKCPDGFYGNSQLLQCGPCDPRCKTCNGPDKAACMECADKFPFKRNGICTDSCADTEVMLPSGCTPAEKCFSSVDLDAPPKFPIDFNDFITKVTITPKPECEKFRDQLLKGVMLQWENVYNGALTENNTKLTIKFANLDAGVKLFNIDLLFNSVKLTSISKATLFKKNRLIINVKNDQTLKFQSGVQILIDASLSFDEGMLDNATGSDIKDPNLKFKWTCPDVLATPCSAVTGNILKIDKKDYQPLFKKPEYAGQITLSLSKDQRTASKLLNFTLTGGVPDVPATTTVPSAPGISTPAPTSAAPPAPVKIDLSMFVQINPLSRGMRNEDYIFGIQFLSDQYTLKDFTYKWTLNGVETIDNYLNGRTETMVRIKNEAVQKGDNNILLDFTATSDGNSYAKVMTFQRSTPPIGGTCTVSPAVGFSLITEYTFETNGWISKKIPLMYKFYMTNSKGSSVSLSDDFQALNTFTSLIVPPGNQFFVDVIDSDGMVATEACGLQNNIDSKTKIDFNTLSQNTKSLKQKLLIKEAQIAMNIPLDDNMAQDSLNLMGQMIDANPAAAVKANADLMLSQLNSITSSASTASNADVKAASDKTIDTLVTNMGSFSHDTDKVSSLFAVIDNSVPAKDPNTPGRMRRTQDVQATEKYDNMIENISNNLYGNIITGQAMAIATSTFNNIIAKVSETSNKDFSIPADDTEDIPKGKVRFRHLAISSNNGPSAFSLNKTEMDAAGVTGLNVMVNKNNDKIPIESDSFSSNSMKFAAYDSENQRRVLFALPEAKMSFRVMLKVPGLNNTDKLNQSACIQYDKKYLPDFSACQTWYDYDNLEVMCLCKSAGLTVNVLDTFLAKSNKDSQFDFGNRINPISLSIVGTLIFILVVMLIIAYCKDKKDEQHLVQMQSKYFDLLQYYMIIYTKEGFHEEYNFWKLFRYTVRTSHPIMSIINIGSSYYRSLRVLDFFQKIYLTFFFSMVPLVFKDNSQLINSMTKRDIKDFGKSIEDIGFNITQVKLLFFRCKLDFARYYVFCHGSLITTVITVGLNAILYADVIRKESEKRESLMKNLCRIYIYKGESEYRYKLRKGMFKIKTVFIIIKSGKSAILQQNSIVSENENENFHDNSKVDLKRRNVNLNSMIKNRELDLIDYNNKCINDNNENENLVNEKIIYDFNNNEDNCFTICRNRSFSIDPKYDSKLLTKNIKNKNIISTDFIFKQRNFVFSEIQTEQIECTYLQFKRIEIIPPLKKNLNLKFFLNNF